MNRLVVDIEIPSQNVRDRWHWSRVRRHLTLCRWAIMAAMGGRLQRRAVGHRSVRITSVRRRRIIDHANLVGGAKSLVDAMTGIGLIEDDSDDLVTITYHQETLRGRRPHTIIEVEGQDS